MKINILRNLLLLISVWVSLHSMAQNISVSSFRLLENDLTANTYGTIERDHNGEVAALLKISTTAQGFSFEAGMVGVVKIQQKVGEIWVYVPHGIKRLSIFHQQLGTLRDYYFPIPIEKARTYEMVLTTGQVETVVNHTLSKQTVVFQVEPANAIVEVDDKLLLVDETGIASDILPYGRYTYRVSCENYHSEVGVLELNSGSKVVKQIQLKPNFGWLQINASDEFQGAYVFLNQQRLGQAPLRTEALKSGSYQLRVMKPMYKNFEQNILINDNQETIVDLQMQPNFAQVTLLCEDSEAEIWVDEQFKGKGRCSLTLEMGQYKAESRRASHKTTTQLIQISSPVDQEITLKAPVPLYASMEIKSTPALANVYIDDQLMGETPLVLNNILVGEHALRLEKPGYLNYSQNISLRHGDNFQLSQSLQADASKSAAQADASKKPTQTKPSSLTETSLPKVQTPTVQAKPEKPAKPIRFAEAKADKTPKLRPNKVPYYRDLSLYAMANGGLECFYSRGFGNLGVGAYYKGINLEYSYGYYDTPIKVDYRFTLGYALPLGKSFMLTPQVSYAVFSAIDYDRGGYSVQDMSWMLGARVQACINKNWALSFSSDYSFNYKLHMTMGLVYNIPLKK